MFSCRSCCKSMTNYLISDVGESAHRGVWKCFDLDIARIPHCSHSYRNQALHRNRIRHPFSSTATSSSVPGAPACPLDSRAVPVFCPCANTQPKESVYRSASSSSGRGIWAASFISSWYCSRTALSTSTSGGARAGAATKSRVALPTSLRASQRKGFSKL